MCPTDLSPPSDWLVAHLDLLAPSARVLDVAAGRGRHAVPVALTGRPVHAVDRDAQALADLDALARGRHLPITTERADLEQGSVSFGHHRYDAVLVFNYLYRPLFPALIEALAPGGVLLYETFTKGQAARGHPRNPAFLLDEGELVRLVAPLAVRHAREGDVGGRLLASIVAEKR